MIPLPSYSDASDSFAGSNAVVSGWGRPSDSVSTISDVLRYVEVEVIANLICNIFFLGLIQNSQVCTSGDGGRSTCNGDSGGPLVVGNKQVSTFLLYIYYCLILFEALRARKNISHLKTKIFIIIKSGFKIVQPTIFI